MCFLSIGGERAERRKYPASPVRFGRQHIERSVADQSVDWIRAELCAVVLPIIIARWILSSRCAYCSVCVCQEAEWLCWKVVLCSVLVVTRVDSWSWNRMQGNVDPVRKKDPVRRFDTALMILGLRRPNVDWNFSADVIVIGYWERKWWSIT